ncbi:MAG: VWA domain-containing protein, partial [Planctomycetota bacterium]
MNESQRIVPESAQRIVYEFARAGTINGWWWWALMIACVVLVLGGAVRFYRRDARELPATTRWTLILLRLTALLGLVFFLLDLQRRTQREITRPSEVVILVDTSQSMSLAVSKDVGSVSRSERAAELLQEESLPETLAAQHRVSVYSFGETPEPVLLETLREEPLDDEEETALAEASGTDADDGSSSVSPVSAAGACLAILATLLAVGSLVYGAGSRRLVNVPSGDGPVGNAMTGRILFATAVALVGGIVLLSIGYSNATDRTLLSLLGLPENAVADEEDVAEETSETQDSIKVLDWNDAVVAAASQSRIGDAVTSILASHDPTTLAGIVIVTDGQNNGGSSIASATASARRSEVAVYPVGLGSSQPPTNVRIVDLDAPRRVYPNDKFFVTAVLQATGGKSMEIKVELLDDLDNDTTAEVDQLLGQAPIDDQTVR